MVKKDSYSSFKLLQRSRFFLFLCVRVFILWLGRENKVLKKIHISFNIVQSPSDSMWIRVHSTYRLPMQDHAGTLSHVQSFWNESLFYKKGI